ncbi:protein crossbronx homolog [Tribolium castaneum]|uniref:Protein crossbronx-like Protein n=1 Tax=Tribolium castaneum TaxID=7070 RepID=D6WJD8_TRICA|nr:PREDICTED: protein crossbronx homolog [Tribolium castaneum]EFA04459.2 Protein crossbronx-like Protein [Tribolium castaneum]|eukprot:XP_008194074.1 PREDICTED: protein crossbronx homolog [Tribolium castaneum]
MYSAVRSSKSDASDNFTRQGSIRKVISIEPKENLFGRQNEDLNKLYKNFHQEYVILAEYKMIQSENIQGVYVIPSRENPFIWFGVIFVRSGPYEDGVFRFNVVLDENFPDSEHPKVVFLSEMFHPVVHPDTNEVHLLKAFPTWNKADQHIWQVLKYIHWMFYNLSPTIAHSVNPEAADLFANNQEAFRNKVKEIVKTSQEKIYDEPPVEDKHYLVFEPYNPEVHEQAKSTMLAQNSEEGVKCGFSWVLPGSFKPLGRPPSPDSESES